MQCNATVSSPCLDLSRKAISELPEEIMACKHLECLYLEGNCLTSLPTSLFSSLSNLHWLDLRNNLLTHLPPSIHTLRELRTLLLQGNRLTSLPPELGQLRQLSGLSLASNPLSSPPPSVVRRGTGAVLHYLRGQLLTRRERGEGQDVCEGERSRGSQERDVDSSSESGNTTSHSIDCCTHSVSPLPDYEDRVVPHLPITKATLTDDVSQESAIGSSQPLVFLKQAHIHHQPSPSSSSPAQTRNTSTQARNGWQREGRTTKKRATGEKRAEEREIRERSGKIVVHVQPLTSEEKLHANIAIEKQRSRERLKEWQKEARIDHLKPVTVLSPPAATDTAPYATDIQDSTTPHEPTQSGEEHSLHSMPRSSRDHDEVLRRRVQQYNKTLQNKRKQAGLITAPSSDLIEAERKLAEALAQRDQMEDRREREYRLTAFTADPNLL